MDGDSSWSSLTFAVALASFVIPLALIFVSIWFSPRFSWESNALSDLGHPVRSPVAPIFNFGLVVGGTFMLFLSPKMFRMYRLTASLVLLAGYSLILVAVFNEAYGKLHFAVSALFFVALILAGFAYSREGGKVYPAVLATLITASWACKFSGLCGFGVAVPEMTSIILSIPWYLDAVLRVSGKPD